MSEMTELAWTSDTPFQALALTGGGYRGLFTARALQVIEEQYGAPIGRCFDLICGTSIGGIVALAVAFEVPMEKVVAVFEEFGERIFPARMPPTTFAGKLLDLTKHLRKPRYDASPLRDAITKLIPVDATLGDALHPLAIPAVNVTEGRQQVFKTRHKAEWVRDWKFSAVDVALATAAAPTFFELAEVGTNVYADGGLFANAPDLIALHEAEHFFSVPREALRLLSIGTTTQTYSIASSAGRRFGVMDWMEGQRLFSVIISCQQQFAEQLVKHRLGKSYVRIDHPATDEQARDLGLDVATEAARRTLIGLADKCVTNVLGTQVPPFLKHKPQLKIVRQS
ncbi:patatin-like phospholipase [Paraburkholderia sp. BL6669N2]|uniref:CBASS cGAMP-activated phospholipase n=1 Tax=Paraburkholderia sp. BL6669N2 TaxID=1938807 RepID=UPI000E23FE29|nr:CBASS cGAMP-activated phospholipase [Paraburkholderia sp. BL6669N2]REG59288.1 patatin-like phospholipase [Paraburkholderia sp. BL6669N2]